MANTPQEIDTNKLRADPRVIDQLNQAVIKEFRDRLLGFVHLPLDPSVALVSKRFVVRLAILLVFASLPIAGSAGFRRMFIALTGTNVIICAMWALLRRERFDGASLTHWDEALLMSSFWLAAHVI